MLHGNLFTVWKFHDFSITQILSEINSARRIGKVPRGGCVLIHGKMFRFLSTKVVSKLLKSDEFYVKFNFDRTKP